MPNVPSQYDAEQVARLGFDDVTRSFRISGGKLVPENYTNLTLAYTLDKLTQVQYFDGATLIATVTLSYTLDKLTGVART